jgi:hypothetical protein
MAVPVKDKFLKISYLFGGGGRAKTSCKSSVWHPAWHRGNGAIPKCLVQGLAAELEDEGGGAAVSGSVMLSFSVSVLPTENDVVSWRPFSSGIILCKHEQTCHTHRRFLQALEHKNTVILPELTSTHWCYKICNGNSSCCPKTSAHLMGFWTTRVFIDQPFGSDIANIGGHPFWKITQANKIMLFSSLRDSSYIQTDVSTKSARAVALYSLFYSAIAFGLKALAVT